MRILHIVEDFSVHSGGLRTVVKNINTNLNEQGCKSYILSSKKEEEDTIFLVNTKNKWLYSKEWKKKVDQIVKSKRINIIHIHGVWLYPQYIGAKYAVKNKIPFVLSFHGMFQPWLWKKGTLKKKLYFRLLTKKWFSRASVIHVITSNEKKNIKRFFKSNKFIEIPNLISFNADKADNYANDEKYILYLGRLNKTKGIELLIKAFSQIQNDSFKLKIAGAINNYKAELDTLVVALNLVDRIDFLGLVKNKEKEELIKGAWAMASPTYSDVIGMVNLEAASLKTPMITTYNTGLKEEWNEHGGQLINPDVEELKEALIKEMNQTVSERNNKGQQLFNFAKENYSWQNRKGDWVQLYKTALK